MAPYLIDFYYVLLLNAQRFVNLRLSADLDRHRTVGLQYPD